MRISYDYHMIFPKQRSHNSNSRIIRICKALSSIHSTGGEHKNELQSLAGRKEVLSSMAAKGGTSKLNVCWAQQNDSRFIHSTIILTMRSSFRGQS